MSAEDGVGFTYLRGEDYPKDSAWVRVIGALDELSVALANVEAVNEMAKRENTGFDFVRTVKRIVKENFLKESVPSGTLNSLYSTFDSLTDPVDLGVLDWSDIDRLNAVKAHIHKMKESICNENDFFEFNLFSAIEGWERNTYEFVSDSDVPSGELVGAQLYLAAAICHRAESEMTSVQSKVPEHVMKYLDKLAKVLHKLAYKHGFMQSAHNIANRSTTF